MCDRSYSDASLGTDLKVAPHIRDALLKAQEAAGAQDSDAFMEPPSFPQAAAANGEALEAALSHANSVASNALRKAATSSRRESQLVTRVNERDHQVRELKGYVHDVLRSQTKEHAYLRATHLDPAVGLEIELGRNEPTSTPPPNDELAEARAAVRAAL